MVVFWCETQENTLENTLSLFSPRVWGKHDKQKKSYEQVKLTELYIYMYATQKKGCNYSVLL